MAQNTLILTIASMVKHPEEVVKKVLETKEGLNKPSYSRIAQRVSRELHYNITEDEVRQIVWLYRWSIGKKSPSKAEKWENVKTTTKGDGIELYSESKRIKTLQDLLDATDVDIDAWDVKNYVVNKWDNVMRDSNDKPVITELYQVKAWLEKKKEVFDKKLLEQTIQTYKAKLSKPVSKINYIKSKSGNIAVINVYDAHLNKLCWGKETGTDYDFKLAEKWYRQVVMELISKVMRSKPEKLVRVIGNDLNNTDNSKSTTTAWTPQTNNLTWKDAVVRIYHIHFHMIDEISKLLPVDLIVEPWNHDQDFVYQLGVALEIYYHKNPNVNVDNSPSSRKYVEHGVNLLGFTHWNNEKDNQIGMLMLTENKDKLANKKHIEMKRGHTHGKKKLISNIWNEINGVEINTTWSISWTDTWHHDKWYTGNKRQWEASIYNKDTGKIADVYARID